LRAKDRSDEPPAPGRNGNSNFHGQKRANAMHESKTDPEAKLFREGSSQPAKLYDRAHAMVENRPSVVVQADATTATGKVEREAVLAMIDRHDRGSEPRITVAADKGYDSWDLVTDLRQKCVTPHVAQKLNGSVTGARTTRHAGYAVSPRRRKFIEEAFGWGKTIASMAKVRAPAEVRPPRPRNRPSD
jgi:hypothetical protein